MMSEVSEKKIDHESEDINLNENDDHCAETVIDTNADDQTSQDEVDGRKISEEDRDESSEEDQEIPNDLVDERVDELEKELLEVKDQLLRAVAETENVRRRAQREKEDTSKYAITSFAREILGVSDNIFRALNSQRKEEEKQANSDLSKEDLLNKFNNFITGVSMIEAELQKTFERIGIEKMDVIGEPFDPKLHNVLFEIEDLDKPMGTILEVIEAGYVLKDRLLREAKVGVSKGGPKKPEVKSTSEGDQKEAEDAAQAYETSAETGSKVNREL